MIKICVLCKKPIETEKECKTWYAVNKDNKIVDTQYTHEDCNTKRQVGLIFGIAPENIEIHDVSNSNFYGINYEEFCKGLDEEYKELYEKWEEKI